MNQELRYTAQQLRGDHFAVTAVWRDIVSRRFTNRYFDPGVGAIYSYLSAADRLLEAIEDAEAVAGSI